MKKGVVEIVRKGKEEEFKKWIQESTEKILESIPTISQKTTVFRFLLDTRSGENNHELIFSIKYHKEYQQLFITAYSGAMKMYQDGEKKNLINGIIHELVHTQTNDLFELAKGRYVREKEIDNACEELTENMSFYVRYYLNKEHKI